MVNKQPFASIESKLFFGKTKLGISFQGNVSTINLISRQNVLLTKIFELSCKRKKVVGAIKTKEMKKTSSSVKKPDM